MKRILVLGSTGSIGTQALDVAAALPGVEVAGLAAGSRADLLAEQARRFRPKAVAINDATGAAALQRELRPLGVEVLAGPEAAEQLARDVPADLAVAAIVGTAGLPAAVAALRSGKDLALANKEALVAAGELIIPLAKRSGRAIIPVDSEHSALFQCLLGEEVKHVARLWLTASGGPFRGYGAAALERVTADQALRHPRWSMGPKVTVDSATLMNKGLEVIEATWLFGLPPERVAVVVHPQSVVHSLVEFVDGSVKAQMSPPDMRLPIQYALTHPSRSAPGHARLDLFAIGQLTFEAPDRTAFPCLDLAYRAARAGGTAPAVLNAANEVAVDAFLAGRARFTDIAATVAGVLEQHDQTVADSLPAVLAADAWARSAAADYLRSR